mmetsp:Transcript_97795/g.276688  ORF Transcript_97795/g.276688 Transcript_97795/m.276688 type:complete len:342 (+) Transcript_97795:758-1783(+)
MLVDLRVRRATRLLQRAVGALRMLVEQPRELLDAAVEAGVHALELPRARAHRVLHVHLPDPRGQEVLDRKLRGVELGVERLDDGGVLLQEVPPGQQPALRLLRPRPQLHHGRVRGRPGALLVRALGLPPAERAREHVEAVPRAAPERLQRREAVLSLRQRTRGVARAVGPVGARAEEAPEAAHEGGLRPQQAAEAALEHRGLPVAPLLGLARGARQLRQLLPRVVQGGAVLVGAALLGAELLLDVPRSLLVLVDPRLDLGGVLVQRLDRLEDDCGDVLPRLLVVLRDPVRPEGRAAVRPGALRLPRHGQQQASGSGGTGPRGGSGARAVTAPCAPPPHQAP